VAAQAQALIQILDHLLQLQAAAAVQAHTHPQHPADRVAVDDQAVAAQAEQQGKVLQVAAAQTQRAALVVAQVQLVAQVQAQQAAQAEQVRHHLLLGQALHTLAVVAAVQTQAVQAVAGAQVEAGQALLAQVQPEQLTLVVVAVVAEITQTAAQVVRA
jgi:hypothetical protein